MEVAFSLQTHAQYNYTLVSTINKKMKLHLHNAKLSLKLRDCRELYLQESN
jgi:hypothetical protein